jgi:hypothetical protein
VSIEFVSRRHASLTLSRGELRRRIRGGQRGGATALQQVAGKRTMTRDAKSSQVVQVTLAAAFDDGRDVIRVPQRALAGAKIRDAGAIAVALASAPVQATQPVGEPNRIRSTNGAHSAIAPEHLLAQVARARAHAPFVHAAVAAKSAATACHFAGAPAAEGAAVGAARQAIGIDPTAFASTNGAHPSIIFAAPRAT